MTVKELLSRIDSRELSEWLAFYRIEPFGEERMDLRFARLSYLMAVSGHLEIEGRKPKMEDFLLRFDPKPKQSEEEIALKINMWMQALKG